MSLTRGNEENKKGVGFIIYQFDSWNAYHCQVLDIWELRQTSTDWPHVIREKVETVFCRWVPLYISASITSHNLLRKQHAQASYINLFCVLKFLTSSLTNIFYVGETLHTF